MVLRKGNNSKTNESNLQDASTQLAISYVRDFSIQAYNYRHNKTEESLNLLNRTASLLSTAMQPHHLCVTQLEVSKFFIDLHAVMDMLAVDSDALWACVSLLQHCSRNLDIRTAIVNEFRFVPLLAYILTRTQTLDKNTTKLLNLLQDLTYGMVITWEEPYLVVLLDQLESIIHNADEEDEETQASLALSILINLCYKNFVVLFLFRRSVNVSTFSRKIQKYGMLASKMMILLSEDIYAPDPEEMQVFLKTTFQSINNCLKNWNVPYLKHIVDFFVDSKSHTGLYNAMCNYPNYCEDVEHLLDQIEARSSMDDSTDESKKSEQICMGLIFKLICYILELSEIPTSDGSENIISLDSNIPRIFELLRNWLDSDVCGVEAINLFETLLRIGRKETLAPRIAQSPTIVNELIAMSEKPETATSKTTAILHLLITLLHQTKTEKLILSKITESYFDKVFAPLLSVKSEMLGHSTISSDDIEKSIFCLLLLINFANIAKKAYFDKCRLLLQMQQIQYALAKAMSDGSQQVCSAVFQISQFEYFPQVQVAKFIAELNTSQNRLSAIAPPQGDQWRDLNAILKSHKTFVSKELEDRLNALVEVIATAQKNNLLQNIPTSQVIELFNHKIEMAACVETTMRNRLDAASKEITHLTQRINAQNAQLEQHQNMYYELQIHQDSLQTQCKDLKHQKDNLKRNTTDLMKKLTEQSESLQINEKRLQVKISEINFLQKDCKELRAELAAKSEELEKLQATSKENVTRIDKLKRTIAAYELDIKEKIKSLEEKEKELTKTHKALEEQKEAKKKSDGVIAVLESQLQEKNEQIRSYEQELSDTEELRKTIMSLMESKKPKRK